MHKLQRTLSYSVCLLGGFAFLESTAIIAGQTTTSPKIPSPNQSRAVVHGQGTVPESRANVKKLAPPTAPQTSDNQQAKIPSIVKVTIVSSRGTISRDASYGIYADFQNVSDNPILLRASETVLVIQPEVAHPVTCIDWAPAIFPTQTPSTATPVSTGNAEIRILPNEHYEVFWDLGQRPPQTNGLCPWETKTTWFYLGFVPGDYAFSVDGIAHVEPADGAPSAHTFTETTTLKVGLSPLVTAVSAFFGGLLAYLVVFLLPGQDFEKWTDAKTWVAKLTVASVWIRNAFSAGLLAASVTIVASRLSDTQFPVKVSVNDLWGALTIGFVSYFAGKKFIAGLADRWVTSAQPAKSQPTPPTGGQATTAQEANPANAVAQGPEQEPPPLAAEAH